MIFIIIPVFNRWHFTELCLISLYKQNYHDFKIVVVDHGSSDNTSEKIAVLFPEVIVLNGDESMWWTAATNLGVEYALNNNANYVLTLNNDLVVPPDYLFQLMKVSNEFPDGIIGSVALDIKKPETIIFAGIKRNSLTAKYRPVMNLNLDYSQLKSNYFIANTDLLPGRGMLVPISVFQKIGLFDGFNFPHYGADEDFSLRARYKGFNLFVAFNATVFSEVEETGLVSSFNKKGLSYLKDTFFSRKSPVMISVRWAWAKRHSRIPVIYFLFDISRIIISQIRKVGN